MQKDCRDGFIPIQRCYPEEYREYRVTAEYYENGFLPIQFFRIRFWKKTGMVLYPHACTLLYFEMDEQEKIRIRYVGRVTETMCTMQEADKRYFMLRFPPQYVFSEYAGVMNEERYLEPEMFGGEELIRQAMAEEVPEASFQLLMRAVEQSGLGFRENKLIDEFVFNSLYNEENYPIEEIISNMSYSPRYVRSVIKSQTGINAKRLYDILRLQHIMGSQILRGEDSLSCVYDFGFYDQAHMNKNIRKLTGLSYSSFQAILKEKNKTNRGNRV